jgi:hypothetical protein
MFEIVKVNIIGILFLHIILYRKNRKESIPKL